MLNCKHFYKTKILKHFLGREYHDNFLFIFFFKLCTFIEQNNELMHVEDTFQLSFLKSYNSF